VLVGCSVWSKVSETEEKITLIEARLGQKRYNEALKLAITLIGNVEDRQRCEVLSSFARAYAGLGKVRTAFYKLKDVLRECKDYPEIQARALYEVALSCRQSDRLRKLGISLLEQVVLRFPNEAVAKRALAYLTEQMVLDKGRVATIKELEALYRKVEGSDVAPSVLFTAGMLETDEKKKLRLMLLLIENYEDSSLWDDAVLESAGIAIRLGAYWDAVELLKRLEARHETSWFFISYETEAFEKARFMEIEARLLATGDKRGIAKAYERFHKDYYGSKRAKDAIRRAVELYLELGDKKSAERLRKKYGVQTEVKK